MPKGPTKRRPQTNARLLDAAFEVFAERGFHGASIGEICDRAGLTTGAFYSNYKTKDELFFALFEIHSSRVLDQVAQAIDDVADEPDPLTALFRRTEIDEYERRWYLVSTEFTLYAIRHPDTARILAEHDARLRAELVRLFDRALRGTGSAKPIDLDSLARLVVALREGSLAQSLVEPDQLPHGALESRYLPLVIKALTTRG